MEKFHQGNELKPSKELPLRYTFYQYHLNLEELSLASPQEAVVDLSRIHHSDYILALTASLYVEAGLSLRQTADVLRILTGVSISHQTVSNWLKSLASLLYPLTLNESASEIIVTDGTEIIPQWEKGIFLSCLRPTNSSNHLFQCRRQRAYSEIGNAYLTSDSEFAVLKINPILQ
jgi:hypothetical protein